MERNEPVPLVPLALVPSAEGGRLPTLYIPCCVSHALRMFRKTSGARPVGGWPGAGLEGAGAGVGFASGACDIGYGRLLLLDSNLEKYSNFSPKYLNYTGIRTILRIILGV